MPLTDGWQHWGSKQGLNLAILIKTYFDEVLRTLFVSIASAIVCVTICACCGNGKPEFTRFECGVSPGSEWPCEEFYHCEDVLVENSPEDTTALAKMIIKYAVEELMSLDEFKSQGLVSIHPNYVNWGKEWPERFGAIQEKVAVTSYFVNFYEKNWRTNRYFTLSQQREPSVHYWERQESIWPELEHADFLGSYSIWKKKELGYIVSIRFNTGIMGVMADPDEAVTARYVLHSDSIVSNPYVTYPYKVDADLTRYYEGLVRERKEP